MVLFPVADRLPPACRTRDAAVSHPADTIAVGLPPPIDLHRYTPGQFADLVMAYLAISPRHHHWAGPGGSAAGGVPVGEADPRRLGVSPPISVPGVPDEMRAAVHDLTSASPGQPASFSPG